MPLALIVDDEPEANKLLSLIVGLRGYETRSAHSGGEAIDLARDENPDIVLLDLMLPDLSGFEVCRAIKAEPDLSLVPVVVVSARMAERNRVESYEAGASDFVPKPYTPDQIFRALATAEAWRRDLEQHGGSGEIGCAGCSEPEIDRRLVGLRCLLRGRTPLADDEVDRLAVAVKALCESACSWGDTRGIDRVATVSYRLQPERLQITVRDESGWFEGGHPPLSEGIRGQVLRRDLFDDITPGPSGRELTLTRRYGTEPGRQNS